MRIEYDKYKVSVQRDGPVLCQLCGRDILVGHTYHDGGDGRRAHVTCVKQTRFDERNLDSKGGNI